MPRWSGRRCPCALRPAWVVASLDPGAGGAPDLAPGALGCQLAGADVPISFCTGPTSRNWTGGSGSGGEGESGSCWGAAQQGDYVRALAGPAAGRWFSVERIWRDGTMQVLADGGRRFVLKPTPTAAEVARGVRAYDWRAPCEIRPSGRNVVTPGDREAGVPGTVEQALSVLRYAGLGSIELLGPDRPE